MTAESESGLTLDYKSIDSNGVILITARIGSDVLACEKLDVLQPERRDRLAAGLCEDCRGLDRAVIDRKLLGIAAQVDANPKARFHSGTIEGERAGMAFGGGIGEFSPPVPLSELDGGDELTWVWEGYLAVGHVTLFSGLWKAGKTTLLAHLLKELGSGGELAGAVSTGKALVVSEESRVLWRRRRDDLGIGDHVHVLIRPFTGRPTREQWGAFTVYLAGLVREEGYALVVYDTVSSLWPVTDENDAARVLAALSPLHAITEAGAAVMLIHHPRKGDAGEGQAARGSGALPGFTDVILELRRFAPSEREDRRRTLTGYSRFDETPGEAVIELTDSGYRMVGSKAEARQCDRLTTIAEIIPSTSPGWTAEQIRSAWPDGGIPKPGLRTIRNDLNHGVAVHLWEVRGVGRKGDPSRFWRNGFHSGKPHVLGAGIECKPESAAGGHPDTTRAFPEPEVLPGLSGTGWATEA